MKYHKPSFFDQFKCIGSACTDTCCAGWEIEVDETTAEGYLTDKDGENVIAYSIGNWNWDWTQICCDKKL